MFIWKCNNANMFSVRGMFKVRVGLGDRKYCLVSIKVIEVYGKSPQFTNLFPLLIFTPTPSEVWMINNLHASVQVQECTMVLTTIFLLQCRFNGDDLLPCNDSLSLPVIKVFLWLLCIIAMCHQLLCLLMGNVIIQVHKVLYILMFSYILMYTEGAAHKIASTCLCQKVFRGIRVFADVMLHDFRFA